MNTKIKIGALVASLIVAVGHVGAATIAQWTFEVTTPADLTNSTTSPTVSADIGSGTATGVHVGAGTDWSTPAGNGSANSFSSNTWASGDYYQFQVSTIGFTGVGLSWDQTSSGTGPVNFGLSYSTDGTSFTSFSTYTVVLSSGTNIVYSDTTTGGSWLNNKAATNTSFAFNLSSIVGLDNQSSVFFRLITSSSPSAAGTGRVDNFTVTASAIPEPSSAALLAGGLTLGAVVVQRRRKAASAQV